MKCVHCDYALWNLHEPRCPECGESFTVNDWDFEPGSVRFRCSAGHAALPHDRPGYGRPRCEACGNTIDWSSVIVSPSDAGANRTTPLKQDQAGIRPWPTALHVLLVLAVFELLLGSDDSFVTLVSGLLIATAGRLVAPRADRAQATIVWLLFSICHSAYALICPGPLL